MISIKNDAHIGFILDKKKVGVAVIIHFLFMGHQSYVLKWPVFSLQRGSAKSPIAPSNFSSLWLIVHTWDFQHHTIKPQTSVYEFFYSDFPFLTIWPPGCIFFLSYVSNIYFKNMPNFQPLINLTLHKPTDTMSCFIEGCLNRI